MNVVEMPKNDGLAQRMREIADELKVVADAGELTGLIVTYSKKDGSAHVMFVGGLTVPFLLTVTNRDIQNWAVTTVD